MHRYRLVKGIALVVVSLFLGAMSRVAARVLPLGYLDNNRGFALQTVHRGLLIPFGRSDAAPQFAIELDGRFPYIHGRYVSAYTAVSVSLLHVPLLLDLGALAARPDGMALMQSAPGCPGSPSFPMPGGGGGGPSPKGGPCGGHPCL